MFIESNMINKVVIYGRLPRGNIDFIFDQFSVRTDVPFCKCL